MVLATEKLSLTGLACQASTVCLISAPSSCLPDVTMQTPFFLVGIANP